MARNKVLHIRLTEGEWTQVELKARDEKRKLSDWARLRIIEPDSNCAAAEVSKVASGVRADGIKATSKRRSVTTADKPAKSETLAEQAVEKVEDELAATWRLLDGEVPPQRIVRKKVECPECHGKWKFCSRCDGRGTVWQ